MIDLWIPGEPRAKGRPRLDVRGRVYTPKATREAEETLRQWFVARRVRPFSGDVRVFMRFQLPTKRRVDLDNLVKLAADAAIGHLWNDDSQVVKFEAELERGSSEPGTRIRVEAA